ncbi:hypothetical protein PG991_000015 [Apiospora marii]|uniref:RCK N-terminal domain-containing protein n=1 Tax=Apiospora marii TaxID=335849 RepID=A0ABR1T0W4_9PEZI
MGCSWWRSMYSLNGDVFPLSGRLDMVFSKGSVVLIVGEAHATGLVQQLGLETDIAIRLHTCGKASQVVRQEHQGQLLLDVARSTPNNGLLLLREGVQDRVVVATAPIVAELLVQKTNDLIKPPNISNFVRKFLGDGLNIVKSERHRWLRKHSL